MSVSVEAAVDGRRTTALTGQAPRRRAKYLVSAARWMFIAPAVVYVAVFFGYPVVKNVVMSFQDYTTRTFFTGEAPWVGLKNYTETIGSSLFTTTVVNTALFTIGSIVAQFVI